MLPLFNRFSEVALNKCGYRSWMTFRGLDGLRCEGKGGKVAGTRHQHVCYVDLFTVVRSLDP